MGTVDCNMSKAEMQGTAILPGGFWLFARNEPWSWTETDSYPIRRSHRIRIRTSWTESLAYRWSSIGIGAWQSSAEGAARGKDGNRCIPSAI